MLFSEKWLRSYINPDLSTKDLAETLTMAGLEVEAVTPRAPAFSGVVVAKVLECVPHENSDHLHVCKVDAGTGEELQIVCGAPNVRAGIKVACAMIGAELPGDFKIKRSKLRGVVSCGMLCSCRELGISEDHDGIWILSDDAPIGEDIRKYADLDDSVIEIKLTPNRGDALSLIGVARDLRAVTGAALTEPDMTAVAPNCDEHMPLEIEAPELCGRFAGRVIRGINPHAQTPEWMKQRLLSAGQRPISALVDISNYVMFELGRPTHFYDLKKVKAPMSVRWARQGEQIELLNEQTVTLDPYYGVVADANGAQGLAGIMGGEPTAIDSETTDVFVEAAFWYPTQIQGRCRRLNFSSDAAHRFERGVDWGSNVEHVEYITRLILDICGTEATKVGPVDDHVANLPEKRVVKMRADRCRKIIGFDISTEFMNEAFTRLGFEFKREGEVFTVTSPTYRFDIEIEEDLIEEVARLYGYQNLPVRPPLARTYMKAVPESCRPVFDLRAAMARRGYQELVNFSFVEEKWEKDFANNDSPIRLLNPIASQLAVMRTQLIGGLVDILRYNLNRKAENVRLFEIGRVFFPDDSVEDGPWTVKGVRQPSHIAGLAYGDAHGEQWGEQARAVDFYDVKGDIETLIMPLKARFVPAKHPALHPGRSAEILIDDKPVGFIGELHPMLCRNYALPKAPIVFEMDVQALVEIPVPHARAVSKFQAVHRDIAVVAPAALSVQTIFDAIDKYRGTPAGAIVDGFELFDLYRPKDDPAVKSMAFHLTLQTYGEEAIGEAAADEAVNGVIEMLTGLGAKLRS
ncbi:MAG TPA: phenylalanine--tRNA ligase subunit beta [Sutterella sp.]|nr:phenylalanine--tRNA ligase subunit beta [Sutterella sp.]